MQRQIANGIIVSVITYILLGVILDGSTLSNLFKLLIAGGVAVSVAKRWDIIALVSSDESTKLSVSSGQILVFGSPMQRPPFLDTACGLFDRKDPYAAYYTSRDDEVKKTGIPPLGKNAQNERRMLESMIESARYERAIRNLPLRDRLNRVILPTIYKDGILIEELPNDDGTVSLIIATGLGSPLGRDAYRQAHSVGIGLYKSAWSERPYATVKSFRHGLFDVEKLSRPGAGIMPLFEVILDEVTLPGEAIQERHGEQVTLDLPESWK